MLTSVCNAILFFSKANKSLKADCLINQTRISEFIQVKLTTTNLHDEFRQRSTYQPTEHKYTEYLVINGKPFGMIVSSSPDMGKFNVVFYFTETPVVTFLSSC